MYAQVAVLMQSAAQDDVHRIAVTDRIQRPGKYNVHNFY